MFQEPALFPWLTAAGNIELALRARDTQAATRATAAELLHIVGLSDSAERGPISCPVECVSGSRSPVPWRKTQTCC